MQGTDLRKLREKKNMTLAQVSEQLNIPATTIAAYERGIRKPKIKNLVKLADFYGVSLSMLDFFDYSDDDSYLQDLTGFSKGKAPSDDLDINYLHQRINRMLEIDNLQELQNELENVIKITHLMQK
ncbi:helix-turn-helix transcriptional regulator [Lactobacillus salivarius]|uniref:helix-turn-helix domain-containing protein n=1 Tax=Ligilactobacillus salivarius TaxID=1624 RepID=UPI0015C5CF4C|nr:helix-turn-helix domain-containing protein [Ligilactobacillus salivarius]MBE7387721.1 helix-turn-helix transcriptional regulator [Ligilactobacillus salivarius]MBE7392098.1 helix-turn-helix transcriptional regulator [Ligilactobacillus salivarius]NXZ96044.1 helix-turn-helix transcriptional regulator [Ligilactobacillus salivarius]NYA58432.1 helix-turn-helix transcriptional regulator [Ligilactobacillus salivarius]NYA61257.1 helix-turn-helix transcriptional regulator [Ligilactobacillus salivariu